MKVPVVMPQLGLTMTEGSVSTWLKKPGESVLKGEMLFVVSTDKADMEVESLDGGTLAGIVVEAGNVVPVGTVIAYLERPGEDVAAAQPVSEVSAPPQPSPVPVESANSAAGKVPPAARAEVSGGEEPVASPRARRLARDLGVDISKVKPSGRSGRIVEEDVRRFAEESKSQTSQAAAPNLRRRQLIAERLTRSIQTIPHFSVSVEVSADQLISLRERVLVQTEKQGGPRVTITDLLLKTLGLALDATPGIRVVWDEGTLREVKKIDLGLAIATDRGVVAPVMRNVKTLGLAEIARHRQEATEKARNGQLSLADLEGGIGTLSNLGMFRVDHFQAIISPGQTFILAVGKIEKRPWVKEGVLTVAPTMMLNLSVDHRAADGALAALFLGKIAEIIENPSQLL